MKKLLIILLFGSLLIAEDKGFFVGASFGEMGYDYKTEYRYNRWIVEQDEDDDGFGATALKVGYYVDHNNRIYTTYYHFTDLDSDQSANTISASWDYVFDGWRDGKIRPFLGVNFSKFTYKKKGYEGWDRDNIKLSSSSIGFQGGFDFVLDDNFFLEISISTIGAEAKDSIYDYDGSDRYSLKVELESVSFFGVGVNYRF